MMQKTYCWPSVHPYQLHSALLGDTMTFLDLHNVSAQDCAIDSAQMQNQICALIGAQGIRVRCSQI